MTDFFESRVVWRGYKDIELKATIAIEGHEREITVVAFYEVESDGVYVDRVGAPANLSAIFERLAVKAIEDRMG